MFGFDNDEEEANEGSRGRFAVRLAKFRADGVPFPRTRHYLWWLVHNIGAHGALALFPVSASFKFHDWTSRRLNGVVGPVPIQAPSPSPGDPDWKWDPDPEALDRARKAVNEYFAKRAKERDHTA